MSGMEAVLNVLLNIYKIIFIAFYHYLEASFV